MKRITITYVITTLAVICLTIIIISSDDCDICYSTQGMMVKFFVCGIVIFIGSLYFTRLYLKNERTIFNIEALPLLETNEATEDVPFSCEGIVTPGEDKLISSPYSNFPCVYYHCITEKYVRSGKNSTWQIIENELGYVPFYISDKRGKIKVDLANLDNDLSGYSIKLKDKNIPDPENSEIDCAPVLVRQLSKQDTTFLGLIPTSEKIRRSEYILPPSVKVFVYGFISRKNNELILHEHDQHSLIISQKNKDQYVEEYYKGKNLVFFIHLLLSLGFTLFLLSINYFLNFSSTLFLVILLSGNVVFISSIIFTMYNRLITLKQRALLSLSDIDVELKRRSELIPKIVDLVKNYSNHEKELFQIIADLRSNRIFEKDLPPLKRPDYSRFIAIIENNPDLKASENFQKLIRTLIDTEERIACSRTFYNRNVGKLNTLISQLPFIIISLIFKIKSMPFISISSDQNITQ